MIITSKKNLWQETSNRLTNVLEMCVCIYIYIYMCVCVYIYTVEFSHLKVYYR